MLTLHNQGVREREVAMQKDLLVGRKFEKDPPLFSSLSITWQNSSRGACGEPVEPRSSSFDEFILSSVEGLRTGFIKESF